MMSNWWAEKRGSQWQVQTEHRGPGSSFCIAPINHWSDDAEAAARMIAAAPDLYAALTELVADLSNVTGIMPTHLRDDLEAAKAALAKAIPND